MSEVNIQAAVQGLNEGINASVSSLSQSLNAEISSSFIYAVSPSARVEQLPNGNVLVTITDKDGTTTAQIPIVSDENIENIIDKYFQEHPVAEKYIQQHNESTSAHQDIRQLIQQAINSIPTKISQLENDKNYITNFKDLILEYNSYHDFPNIPSEKQRKQIFLDKSTGDMYIFGIGNSLTYSSIGISSQDYIYGGDSNS